MLAEFLTLRSGVLALLGVTAIALAALAVPIHNPTDNTTFVLCLLASGGVAWAATGWVSKTPQTAALIIILVVALIIRIIAMSGPPLVSTDVYRYVWDGRTQGEGINPFRYIPADPALQFLRDNAIYPNINRADYAHTAYPPVAQMFFFLATRLGDNLLAIRGSLVLCEAATIYVIWQILKKMALPGVLVVGYAWHPLAVWEVANGGHIDALMTLLAALALLLLMSGHRLVGVVFAAAAILVKPHAVVLLPAFWRRWDWRAPALVLLAIALLYLPYLSVGSGVIGFVPTYMHEERLDTGGAFWLVLVARAVFGNAPWLLAAYVLLGVGVFTYFTLRILRQPAVYEPRQQYRDAMFLLVIGTFFLSPNYAWYYLPLVPFVALGGRPALWMMTLGAIVLHAGPMGQGPDHRFLVTKSILNLGWILALAIPWGLDRLRHHQQERLAA